MSIAKKNLSIPSREKSHEILPNVKRKSSSKTTASTEITTLTKKTMSPKLKITSENTISTETTTTIKTKISTETTITVETVISNKTTVSKKFEDHLDSTKKLPIENEDDFCDCNDKTCPGCFFPCDSCGSGKCGHQCRINRDWKSYDVWIIEGEEVAEAEDNDLEIVELEDNDEEEE